jgi:LPPG:FO 2-phospho-L-lactate transferase
MSDHRVETHVVIVDEDAPSGRRAVHFQEWWLRLGAAVPAQEFVFVGADVATPAPGVDDAIGSADVVLLAPSNPVVSIGAILAVPGLAEAVRTTSARVVGLSPIVGGAPVRGMADACLTAVGVETTAYAVARHYGSRDNDGLLDGWLVDESDKEAADRLDEEGLRSRAVPLLMTYLDAAAAMAVAAIDLATSGRP